MTIHVTCYALLMVDENNIPLPYSDWTPYMVDEQEFYLWDNLLFINEFSLMSLKDFPFSDYRRRILVEEGTQGYRHLAKRVGINPRYLQLCFSKPRKDHPTDEMCISSLVGGRKIIFLQAFQSINRYKYFIDKIILIKRNKPVSVKNKPLCLRNHVMTTETYKQESCQGLRNYVSIWELPNRVVD